MKKCFIIIVIISLLCSCVSKSRYNKSIHRLEYEISSLEEEKEELEEQVETLQEQVETLEDIIERAKRQCILWDDDAYMALRVLNEY